MHRILLSTVAGALVAVAVPLAPVAVAAPPPVAPSAYVRVEGAGATLLPQTLAPTSFASKVKGNACPGTSDAGALDAATAGNWSGSYSAKFNDYLVGTILGETPSGNNFWTLWVNGRSSSTGACSTTVHPGDHILWFDCQADANFNCTNNPLALSGPTVAQRGHRLTLRVVQLDGAGHSTAVPGAAVGGDGIAGVTGAAGATTVVPRTAGVITVQARKSGATPSDPLAVCVYVRRRSECGSANRGPAVHIAAIKEHEQFARNHAPRELAGTAGPDPAGLTDVSFSLFRRSPNGRCSIFDADHGTFRPRNCHVHARIPSFSIGASASWSYLLPKALGPGQYSLAVTATDGAGRSGGSTRDFSVSSAGTARATAARPAPTVQIMVVGRTRTLVGARTVKLSATTVAIGHHRCAVPAGTALAGLIAVHANPRVTDIAGCDPSSLFVTKVGHDANHGDQGWEYKVGHKSPSSGAGDTSGRLKANQQLLWFWCTRANFCERTLDVSRNGNTVRVLGYDDNGHGQPVAGATVHVDSGQTVTTGADGSAQLTIAPGRHTLYATKTGLVQSFPQKFTAGP